VKNEKEQIKKYFKVTPEFEQGMNMLL